MMSGHRSLERVDRFEKDTFERQVLSLERPKPLWVDLHPMGIDGLIVLVTTLLQTQRLVADARQTIGTYSVKQAAPCVSVRVQITVVSVHSLQWHFKKYVIPYGSNLKSSWVLILPNHQHAAWQ